MKTSMKIISLIRHLTIILGLVIFLDLEILPSVYASEENSLSKHWIIDAPSELEKEKRLEKYLRGFDQPMWEVGERYKMIKHAIKRKNFNLANYHWEKIKTTIENGLMKRPARKNNANRFLLDSSWQEIKNDINSKNSMQADLGLQKMKAACLGCHLAEGLSFINNQPMFY